MKYFAYGSNMSLKRIQQRIPSAKRLGLYQLKNHQLKFHKKSKDGSGKCNAYHTNNPQHSIFGALFDIDQADKTTLDKIEGVGKGYEIKEVMVHGPAQQQVSAYIYVATDIDANLLPFSWYLNHVIVGAREIGVPMEYLDTLNNTTAIEDSDTNRATINNAIHD